LLVATYILLPPLNAKISQQQTKASIRNQARVYADFVMSTTTRNALLAAFFASAGTMGFLAYVGVWLYDSFGISSKQVGWVFLVSGAAALFASPLAGSLSDRIGKKRQFILSNIGLAFFLMILPEARSKITLFGMCALISLSAAFRQGPMEALLTEVVAARMRGTFIALKNSFSQLGIALAALVSGFLFERSGYLAVCVLCATANLVSAGMIILVRNKRIQ